MADERSASFRGVRDSRCVEMDSQAAAIYEWYWWIVLMDVFKDDLPEEYWPGGGNRWFEVMRQLVNDPKSPWWDDKSTEGLIESRNDILQRAFNETVSLMEQNYGSETSR